MLDAKTWWPLFPLLLLLVVVSLTWALVIAVRGRKDERARWLQIGAFVCYSLAAASAIASERGLVSANLHRPFSLLTQLCLLGALLHHWKGNRQTLLWLNGVAWVGILADGALHFLMIKHHERFYCNRGFAAATNLDTAGLASRQAGSPLGRSTYCFKYASLPYGSARLSRQATARFRDEPS